MKAHPRYVRGDGKRFDSGASAAFVDKVGRPNTNVNPSMLIDCAGVDFVASGGLRTALIIVTKAKAAGSLLALYSVAGISPRRTIVGPISSQCERLVSSLSLPFGL